MVPHCYASNQHLHLFFPQQRFHVAVNRPIMFESLSNPHKERINYSIYRANLPQQCLANAASQRNRAENHPYPAHLLQNPAIHYARVPPSSERFIITTNELPAGLQIASTRNHRMTKEWRFEWEAVSADLVPSRPLSMLMEPANINLNIHSRRAQSSELSHFDVDHEPQGRRAQRQVRNAWNKKRVEKSLQKPLAIRSRARIMECKTSNVRIMAKEVEVIDLTDEL